MSALSDLILTRKSVRTYDGRPLTAEDRGKLECFAAEIPNPFGISVRFVFLDAAAHGLSSPVLTGETLYVAGVVKKGSYADVALGFSFEKLVLYAWSLGVGTVWIRGTMKRELFERAAGFAEGEMMPCVSPLGYPAAKRSIKETMMRAGINADARLPLEKLFFDGAWERPLTPTGELAGLAELVRWAPSAVNRQPWRVIVADGGYHFYEKKDRGGFDEKTGDVQKIDLGIALCHFVTGLEERGGTPRVAIDDPGLAVPADVDYIATVIPE